MLSCCFRSRPGVLCSGRSGVCVVLSISASLLLLCIWTAPDFVLIPWSLDALSRLFLSSEPRCSSVDSTASHSIALTLRVPQFELLFFQVVAVVPVLPQLVVVMLVVMLLLRRRSPRLKKTTWPHQLPAFSVTMVMTIKHSSCTQ